jgi:flagellar biosynthesis/type III secretory pathway chaperone
MSASLALAPRSGTPESAEGPAPQAGPLPERIAGLLSVTSRLIDVLEREIEMLRGMKPSEMQALQHDKIVLAAAYEAAVRDLNGDAAALEQVAPAVRAELRATTERFQAALAANERALRAAKEATDRLLKHIVAEAERQRGQPSAYGARGGRAVATAGAGALSLTVDRRL